MFTLFVLRMRIECGLPVKNWVPCGPYELQTALNKCCDTWGLDFRIQDDKSGLIHHVEWELDSAGFETPKLGSQVEP